MATMDPVASILYTVDPDYGQDVILGVKSKLKDHYLIEDIHIALYYTINFPFDIRELSPFFVDTEHLEEYNVSLLRIIKQENIELMFGQMKL